MDSPMELELPVAKDFTISTTSENSPGTRKKQVNKPQKVSAKPQSIDSSVQLKPPVGVAKDSTISKTSENSQRNLKKVTKPKQITAVLESMDSVMESDTLKRPKSMELDPADDRSKILEDSTKTKKVDKLEPFWTKKSKEISEKLSLHTNVVPEEVAPRVLNLPWNRSLKNLCRKSWYKANMIQLKQLPSKEEEKSTKSPKSTQSPICLWQEITRDMELQKNALRSSSEGWRSRKIRIFPNDKQKKTLLEWLGSARKTYNLCLAEFKKIETSCKKKKTSFKIKEVLRRLRYEFVNVDGLELNEDLKYLLETPSGIRHCALNDLDNNLKSNFARKSQFELKFRSRKDPHQSFVVEHDHARYENGKYAFIRNIRTCVPVTVNWFEHDFRILLDQQKHFYFCLPRPLERRNENQAPVFQGNKGVLALDPGVRKFMTGFDPTGRVIMVGIQDFKRVEDLSQNYDKLLSKWSKPEVRHKNRYRMKKAGRRIVAKIRNLVDELHKKLCKWLCENYRVILLPKFETSKMVIKNLYDERRRNRKINSKTARNMLTWAHYRFRQRLAFKIQEYPWCKVFLVDESYTSKTCGKCGEINGKLGPSETFTCPSCKWIMDRDINGARNILIKYLTGSAHIMSRIFH